MRWVRVEGPKLPEYTACQAPPAAPPRYAPAERIADGVCPAERRRDLIAALDAMERADRLVAGAVPMRDPIPHTTQIGRSRVDPRLSAVASRLIRQRVDIHCWNARDWPNVLASWHALTEDTLDAAGFVWDGNAQLRGDYCDIAGRFAQRPTGGGLLQGFSLDIVAHEARHVASPDWAEWQVECWALQQVAPAAQMLGAAPSLAHRLARIQWRMVYPHEGVKYRSTLCRPGGDLDETPGDGVWP